MVFLGAELALFLHYRDHPQLVLVGFSYSNPPALAEPYRYLWLPGWNICVKIVLHCFL